ncbi:MULTISPECIES: 2Fe-2S iron-sulfur cluster-binding protein [Ramlibacter]|uniref:2Fe-2S iron-sulfur cluster binding domain-containing protein n=1 Tax=Ramlibacter pinisoli TaxID=2682844 RepID=A0A6N8IQB4_9BURK|nr:MULTISPECIES: 2Fe-2S iron-sulfur cluster-binding protein [Ramlibacter]MBA2964072.1 2Fe-2S iron-sulfur cluster binding domain-containing protein [Ramlibacter sp. CGMCC 1.13660]MVQ29038.1 2Fe-2S iron-sulfur cluster binding domain-containing protein [Ramlibacter pinisoli]
MAGDDEDDESSTRAWQVRLGPDGPAFEARADRPLLQSAEAAGWPLPSSCRNGTCRTCIQRLRSGRVHYAIAWPGVLAEERREGWILPCVAHPRSDLVLDDPLAQSLPVT